MTIRINDSPPGIISSAGEHGARSTRGARMSSTRRDVTKAHDLALGKIFDHLKNPRLQRRESTR